MSSRLAFFGIGAGSPDEIARGKRRAGTYTFYASIVATDLEKERYVIFSFFLWLPYKSSLFHDDLLFNRSRVHNIIRCFLCSPIHSFL